MIYKKKCEFLVSYRITDKFSYILFLITVNSLFVSKAYIVLETCYVHVGILLDGNSNQVRLFYDYQNVYRS